MMSVMDTVQNIAIILLALAFIIYVLTHRVR